MRIYMLHRLIVVPNMPAMDWLSRLFEMMPVRGRVDVRCLYGAPWRIEQRPGEVGEMPLLLPGNPRHVLHDGSGAPPMPARNRSALNLTISENPGTGERLDML